METVKKMIHYKIEAPSNYENRIRVGEKVGNAILSRRVPSPLQIATVFGEEAVNPYIVMHALMHSVEYGRGRGVLEPARKDGKAIQIHSFDSTFRPLNRLFDNQYPSGYFLDPENEAGEELGHDNREEFGKTPLGSLVVGDCMRYLLGERIARYAGLLTNDDALVVDPLDEVRRISSKNHKSLDEISDIVYDLLDKESSKVDFSPGNVSGEYQKFMKALKDFETYVREGVDYMPGPEKNDLLYRLNTMLEKLRIKTKNKEFLETDYVNERVIGQHEHIMEIIKNREYTEIDEKLLLPDEPRFLLILKKALYHDFVNNKIAEEVRCNPYSVSPLVLKSSDNTDSINKMGHNLPHIISVFRKARELMRVGLDVTKHVKGIADELRESGNSEEADLLNRNYERLFIATYSTKINLEGVIEERLVNLATSSKRDNTFYQDLGKFKIMEEKMEELEDVFTDTGDEICIWDNPDVQKLFKIPTESLLQ